MYINTIFLPNLITHYTNNNVIDGYDSKYESLQTSE